MTLAADTSLAVPLSNPAPPSGPVRFMDRGGLFGLLVKNAFLTLVTLGIYRFWARAALRRYWWGSIMIAGDPLEYTGTGLELFIGFLMFLAIMLPFGAVYGLTGLLQRSNPGAFALLHIAEGLVFFVLIQFVTFRARRYRLSRTLWRGVRASQGGTSWQYLRLVIGWTLLSAITLGIAIPWARIATTRYLMDRTALGDLEARFDGRGRDLLLPWLLVFVPFFAGLGMFFALTIHFTPAGATPQVVPGIWALATGEILTAFGLLIYLLIEARYTIRHTRFGEIQLGSGLSIGGVIFTVIGFLVAAVVILLVLVIGIAVVMGVSSSHAAANPSTIGIVTTIAAFVIGFGLIGILRILWIDRAIVRQICDTMSMTNVDRLDRIGQSTAPIPRAGEGMADSFDIGAF